MNDRGCFLCFDNFLINSDTNQKFLLFMQNFSDPVNFSDLWSVLSDFAKFR